MAEKRSVVAVCAVACYCHFYDAKPPPSKGSSVVVQSTNLMPEFDPGKGLYSTFFFFNQYLSRGIQFSRARKRWQKLTSAKRVTWSSKTW